MMGLGGKEMLIILAVILLLFGSAKIPSLARSLGKSINEFKKGRQEGKDDQSTAEDSSDTKKPV